MSDIEKFLEATQAQFKRRFKDTETEAILAKDEQPVDGLVVDKPLLEFILDRRFIAFGRAYLFYAKKGNAKTSLFYEFVKLFQKQGGWGIFLETEHAVDMDYIKKQGIDTSRLIIEHPESLEQAFEKVKMYVQNLDKLGVDVPVIICLDSIAGAVPEYEQESERIIGETKVGEHAKICSQFYRRIENLLAYEKCIFVACNQLKVAIGKFVPAGVKSEDGPEALIGGEAQFYHSTYHFKMARTADMVKKDDFGAARKIGSMHTITCKRNKLGREGSSQKIPFHLYIDGGVDWDTPLPEFLAEKGYDAILTGGDKGKGPYSWKVPDCEYEIKAGDGTVVEKGVIGTGKDDKYKSSVLGQMIAGSPKAKEIIRKAFGIPDLPPSAVVEQVEETRKVKRKAKKSKAEQEEEKVL